MVLEVRRSGEWLNWKKKEVIDVGTRRMRDLNRNSGILVSLSAW